MSTPFAADHMVAEISRLRAEIEKLENRIIELETPDQYWDAHNPEHEAMYDEQGIAELLFDRYPDGYKHAVVCAKKLPHRHIKVWDDNDGIDDFINWELVK